MLALYKRKAWLVDDGVLLAGYTAKRKFIPYESDYCGFSSKKIRKRDVGRVLFYDKREAMTKTGLQILRK